MTTVAYFMQMCDFGETFAHQCPFLIQCFGTSPSNPAVIPLIKNPKLSYL